MQPEGQQAVGGLLLALGLSTGIRNQQRKAHIVALTITINTAEPLSLLDIQILQQYIGVVTGAAEAKATAPKAEAPVSAPKAAPAAKAEPKVVEPISKEQVEADDADAEEEDNADLLGATRTPADAMAAATKLVSDGKAALVKTALKAVDTKRVGELTADKVEAWFAALEA